MKLPVLAIACDRTGVSDRTAAIIFSAVLKDVGLLSETNPTMTIDRMKIRRTRKEQRELLIHNKTKTTLLAIFFDGRKDKALSYKKHEEYEHFRRSTILEHISILQKTGSNYLEHVTPEKSTAKEVKKLILNFLSTKYGTNRM